MLQTNYCRLSVFAIAVLCAPAAALAQAPATAGRDAPTHAQPGDRLLFHLLGEPELTLAVDDRGRVPLPRLGLVDVSAWPIADLTDTLTARYAAFYQKPAIELTVQRRVTVDGEIARPDVYYVEPSTDLRDLIARAGGLSPAANANKVWIVRHGERIPTPAWQTDDARRWLLQSGDEVTIGRRNWLAVNALGAISAAAVVFSVLYSVTR